MKRIAFGLLAVALLIPRPSRAFCGFFVAGSNQKLTNRASQVALVRRGNRTALTMSNSYQGPPENFAMVVPVPVVLKKEDVKTLPPDVFEHIDQLTAPRLVEYWEQDPCRSQINKDEGIMTPTLRAPQGHAQYRSSRGVKVEAQFAVGEYEIVVLSAKESNGLETWLRENRYTIPQGAAAALAPYVRQQMKFFVAKVDIKKVHRNNQGLVVLSPLRVSYQSNELRLPVRLGLLNAENKQDLIVYVLHPRSRFEVANYPNVFIPTNLEVADEVKGVFAPFYAELFDATLLQRGGKAVVTEYAWQTTSCDPCPAPPLGASDLLTLGADAVDPNHLLTRGGNASWVVTRLHTRYDKTTLSEDLIFQEAKPVLGGRAQWNGASADAGAQVVASGINNFQGRYIIRHYWQGKVACEHPHYGAWGGPNGTSSSNRSASAARGLATVERGKLDLKKVTRSPVPTLGIPGQPPPRHKNQN